MSSIHTVDSTAWEIYITTSVFVSAGIVISYVLTTHVSHTKYVTFLTHLKELLL